MDMRKHFEIKADLKVDKIKPGHGNCCTCQECGHYHDDCVCWENRSVEACEAYEQLQAKLKKSKKLSILNCIECDYLSTDCCGILYNSKDGRILCNDCGREFDITLKGE